MPLFDRDNKLSDILFHEPSTLTVINRFGIYLGVGDATVDEICTKHGIDPVFFISIINTYLNEDYFPENTLQSVNLKLIADYLAKTDSYYEQFQLPNIDRHFNSLVTNSQALSYELSLLRKFFLQMKEELLDNIHRDHEMLFPFLEDLYNQRVPASQFTSLYSGVQCYDGHQIEEKIEDLLSFFIIHLEGSYDQNLCHAVVSAVFTLCRDIKQNNRIRERILQPLVKMHANSDR